AAAVFYTLIETAKSNGHNPRLWLTRVLEAIGRERDLTDHDDLGDGVADRGLILRNDLRLPGFPLIRDDAVQPFAFLDGAIGTDFGGRRTLSLAGTGLGLDYRFAGYLTMGLTAGVALLDEDKRRAGDLDLRVRISTIY
ncbi:hypothetical protein GAY33_30430, partial [Azospirillum brasilense]|uniref:transposase domain-containing protein n=1 Tax=Azospirillum argentinense TaxID=2970906 RepID=UPI00190EF57A